MRWNDCQDANVPGRIRELGYTESPCTAGHMGPDGVERGDRKVSTPYPTLRCQPFRTFFCRIDLAASIWITREPAPIRATYVVP